MLHRSYAIWDLKNKGSSQGMRSLRHSGLKLGVLVGRERCLISSFEINAGFFLTNNLKFPWSKDSHYLFAAFLLKPCESSKIKIMQRSRVTERAIFSRHYYIP